MKACYMLAGMASLVLSGCATTGATDLSSDPLEGFNRNVFAFNSAVDRNLLEPVAKGYRAIAPAPVRDGVSNALGNLKEPVTMANQVLQGDLAGAGETVGRFAMNSTLGVAGFVDAAGSFGHDRVKEDFGQTLAVWGVDSGPYIVVPLMGPATPRSLVGAGVDTALQPLNYASFENADEFRIGRTIIGLVSAREAGIETMDSLYEQQADPYIAMRHLYGKLRAADIRNGEDDPNARPDPPNYDEY